jgi:hypothetical protein
MIYRIIFPIFYITQKSEKLILGRWGYHWERYKDIQKYYE